jgi:hypothetical protein
LDVVSEQPAEQPVEQIHIDPFDGDSMSFDVTSPIDISQLQEEISEKVGEQVQAVLSVEDIDHTISVGRPAVVFVHPKSLDGRTVRGAITSHVPIVPVTNEVSTEITAALEKLASGATLTTAEISLVLTLLVSK